MKISFFLLVLLTCYNAFCGPKCNEYAVYINENKGAMNEAIEAAKWGSNRSRTQHFTDKAKENYDFALNSIKMQVGTTFGSPLYESIIQRNDENRCEASLSEIQVAWELIKELEGMTKEKMEKEYPGKSPWGIKSQWGR